MSKKITNNIFYSISCKSIDECSDGFVGHTTNLTRHKQIHKQNCISGNKTCTLYKTINKYGGWDNWEVKKLATIANLTEDRILEIVDQYINELKFFLTTVECSQKFYCDVCKINCRAKSHLEKHYQTDKHIKSQIIYDRYNSELQLKHANLTEKIEHERNQLQEKLEYETTKQREMDLIRTMFEKHDGLTHKLLELAHEKTVTNNNNNINTNNTINNKFNLNLFLNETCKDAMDLTDFVRQMKFCVEDLIHMGEVGFTNGMSHIFVKGLSTVEKSRRPIHCTDLKRKTLYIKENGVWEKENPDRTHMINAVRQIGRDNLKTLVEWTNKHPDYNDYDSKANTQYMRIVGNAMPGCTDDEIEKSYKQIIHAVACEVPVPKSFD